MRLSVREEDFEVRAVSEPIGETTCRDVSKQNPHASKWIVKGRDRCLMIYSQRADFSLIGDGFTVVVEKNRQVFGRRKTCGVCYFVAQKAMKTQGRAHHGNLY